jgi:hypothetical protein
MRAFSYMSMTNQLKLTKGSDGRNENVRAVALAINDELSLNNSMGCHDTQASDPPLCSL